MDVAGGRDTSATIVLGKGQRKLARGRVDDRARVDDPIVLGRVTVEVRRVGEDTREISEGVLHQSRQRQLTLMLPARERESRGSDGDYR